MPGVHRFTSKVELERLIQPRQLLRVAHHVDAGDPPVLHREARRGKLAVDLDQAGRRTVEPHCHRVERGRRPVHAGEQRRDGLGPVDRSQDGGRDAAAICDQDDFGRHDLHQLLQPPGSQRGEEPLDHGLLLGSAHAHARPPSGHVLACPPRDLPHRGRGLRDGFGDLAVRHLEDLAEHEHRPLGRRERLQHGQHRDRDALGELDVLGDIGTGQQRLRQPLADVFLAAARPRSQEVERLSCDDPDQVRPRVTHLRVVDVVPPQPGLLQYVLRVGRRPEHLVGDREQQAAMDDERIVAHAVATPGALRRLGRVVSRTRRSSPAT